MSVSFMMRVMSVVVLMVIGLWIRGVVVMKTVGMILLMNRMMMKKIN